MLAPIERVDLTELIGNLLDNAMRHAATRVRVSCDDGAGRLLVTIEDDGPGLDPDLEARVRQRGKRLDNGGAAASASPSPSPRTYWTPMVGTWSFPVRRSAG
jgi:signal transduction histidine kinase